MYSVENACPVMNQTFFSFKKIPFLFCLLTLICSFVILLLSCFPLHYTSLRVFHDHFIARDLKRLLSTPDLSLTCLSLKSLQYFPVRLKMTGQKWKFPTFSHLSQTLTASSLLAPSLNPGVFDLSLSPLLLASKSYSFLFCNIFIQNIQSNSWFGFFLPPWLPPPTPSLYLVFFSDSLASLDQLLSLCFLTHHLWSSPVTPLLSCTLFKVIKVYHYFTHSWNICSTISLNYPLLSSDSKVRVILPICLSLASLMTISALLLFHRISPI